MALGDDDINNAGATSDINAIVGSTEREGGERTRDPSGSRDHEREREGDTGFTEIEGGERSRNPSGTRDHETERERGTEGIGAFLSAMALGDDDTNNAGATSDENVTVGSTEREGRERSRDPSGSRDHERERERDTGSTEREGGERTRDPTGSRDHEREREGDTEGVGAFLSVMVLGDDDTSNTGATSDINATIGSTEREGGERSRDPSGSTDPNGTRGHERERKRDTEGIGAFQSDMAIGDDDTNNAGATIDMNVTVGSMEREGGERSRDASGSRDHEREREGDTEGIGAFLHAMALGGDDTNNTGATSDIYATVGSTERDGGQRSRDPSGSTDPSGTRDHERERERNTEGIGAFLSAMALGDDDTYNAGATCDMNVTVGSTEREGRERSRDPSGTRDHERERERDTEGIGAFLSAMAIGDDETNNAGATCGINATIGSTEREGRERCRDASGGTDPSRSRDLEREWERDTEDIGAFLSAMALDGDDTNIAGATSDLNATVGRRSQSLEDPRWTSRSRSTSQSARPKHGSTSGRRSRSQEVPRRTSQSGRPEARSTASSSGAAISGQNQDNAGNASHRREHQSPIESANASHQGSKALSRESPELTTAERGCHVPRNISHSRSGRHEHGRDRSRDGRRDRSRDGGIDRSRYGDRSREGRKERSRDGGRDRSREGRRDRSRDGGRDRSREGRRDWSRDGGRDRRKERSGDRRKERSGDRRKERSGDGRRERSRGESRDRSRDGRRNRSRDGRRERSRGESRDGSREKRRDGGRGESRDGGRERRRGMSRNGGRGVSRDRVHRSEQRWRQRKERRSDQRCRGKQEHRQRWSWKRGVPKPKLDTMITKEAGSVQLNMTVIVTDEMRDTTRFFPH